MKAGPEQREALRRAASMRIGLEGYARILGSLRKRPKSTADLAAEHGVSHLAVLLVMRHCLRAKVVHRPSWYRPAPHSRMVPTWALGAEGDVSMPMYEERTRRPRRAPSTLILLTTAIELLRDAAMTRQELAEELCMHVETAQRIARALRDAGLVYVESWNKSPMGKPAEELRYGNRKDAPRPATKSEAEYFAQRRSRLKDAILLQLLRSESREQCA